MKVSQKLLPKFITALLSAAVLCALAALTAGCGGGGSSKPELGASSLSRAVYVKKVNGLCKSWARRQFDEMKRVGAQPIAQTSPEKAMKEIWAPGLREEAEEIRKTGAPAGDAPKIEAVLTALEKAAEEVEVHEPEEILQLQALLEPVNRFAGAYGLEGCEF